jgi:GTP-binding protein HflX
MSKKVSEPTQPPRERAFLVGVEIKKQPGNLSLDDSLVELNALADTAQLDVVGEATQRLDQPHTETYVGSGKVEEIKALVEETQANVVIFDNELLPRHIRELELKFGKEIRVLDRTALILDIFALHANTKEGSLQVELAQYEYRLPRLTRAWTHLSRQAGGASGRSGSTGGVGLRGPGETQLEVDRREVSRRITALKAELEKVRAHRMRYREQRKRTQIPVISIVGYTNSGKSTLLNKLTNAGVYVADQLFATLDPVTRRVKLGNDKWVLFTDTVGFIQKLPTQLIAAFRATLEEISEADLLVHVVDATQPNAKAQWLAVEETLKEINAGHIPMITVLNKNDRLKDSEHINAIKAYFQDALVISAKTGAGLDDLKKAIHNHLYETQINIRVKLPYQQGNLISQLYDLGQVSQVTHGRGSVIMEAKIPGRLSAQYKPYLILSDTKRSEYVEEIIQVD